MSYKLLHLNILAGKYLPRIVKFVRQQDFDILHFQELAGGLFIKHLGGVKGHKVGDDNFRLLQTKLPAYQGFLAKSATFKGQPASYFGDATFVKKGIPVLRTKTVWLKPFRELTAPELQHGETWPRQAISQTLVLNRKKIALLNTHLAWGPRPTDEPYKLKQARILYKHVKDLKVPYIFSGDFNLTPRSRVVKWFDTLGNNLTTKNKIKNTLNPRVHRVKNLFPKGLAVDFVYIHPAIKVKKFRLLKKPDLSDHYGLILEFGI